MSERLPTEIAPARASWMLTEAEFHRLADVPPEVEWFANPKPAEPEPISLM
jgi:integrase/recombinase XerD